MNCLPKRLIHGHRHRSQRPVAAVLTALVLLGLGGFGGMNPARADGGRTMPASVPKAYTQ